MATTRAGALGIVLVQSSMVGHEYACRVVLAEIKTIWKLIISTDPFPILCMILITKLEVYCFVLLVQSNHVKLASV
jgi:hypothetical protein